MSDSNNLLEQYCLEKIKVIDPTARKSPGSGCGASVGDINSKYVFCGAKIKHTQENFIIDRKKDWLSLVKRMPNVTDKFLFLINENQYGERIVSLTSEDFFNLLYKAFEKE